MEHKHPRLSDRLGPPLTRRRRLELDLEHVTQEMYQRNRELAESNQTLSLLQIISGLALDATESLVVVSTHIAEAVAETMGFPLVGILTTDTGSMAGLTLNGNNLKDSKAWQAIVDKRKALRLPLHSKHWNGADATKLISLKELESVQMAHWLGCSPKQVEALRKALNVQTLYITQLKARGRLVGVVVIGLFGYAEQVRPQDLALIDRLSETIGVALDNRLLFEENKRVLTQLRHSNTQLKALDETKDDFISMASHQLRTPLTSVKGYLSMVLDGDAGPLNTNQHKLLEQSFRSSEQMVYLISDLLNLSRINTGKFVIETSPIDLSELVQFEIGQLLETAKSRDLSLKYDRPDSFPKLMLDDTKIHQVIMNFIDNAIYYTPSGGTITVTLRETASSIEFIVQDTGIGVPKNAQHRLFTKFYRADNAQKARPDGTGLGLFMAKKVVVALSGSIIFDSQEGKGSTFGFRFSKADHLIPSSLVK